ncbi:MULTISPECIES: hypothetical protein [Sorangium]|uniref:hypothetical protein n=1 Tax=Sorangium TaxID=39643 RepID=UPI003D9C207D
MADGDESAAPSRGRRAGRSLSPEAKRVVKGTALANNRREPLALSRLPAKE